MIKTFPTNTEKAVIDLLNIVTFTSHGLKIAEMISGLMDSCTYFFGSDLREEQAGKICPGVRTGLDLKECIKKIVIGDDAVLFISACAIAVRLIAPHIRDKKTDIPVVVMDDGGRYAISLLSGHEGGANAITARIAGKLGIESIITTGTEAKKELILGIGYRKDVPAAILEKAIFKMLDENNVDIQNIRIISTIDIKRGDGNLEYLADKLGIPLRYIEKNRIGAIEDSFSKSSIVKDNVGVGNVCEAAAILAGARTEIIVPKRTYYRKVALAIARERSLWEE